MSFFFSARNLFLTKSESVAIEMYFCLSVSHSLKLEHLRFEQKSSGGQTKRPTSRIRKKGGTIGAAGKTL